VLKGISIADKAHSLQRSFSRLVGGVNGGYATLLVHFPSNYPSGADPLPTLFVNAPNPSKDQTTFECVEEQRGTFRWAAFHSMYHLLPVLHFLC